MLSCKVIHSSMKKLAFLHQAFFSFWKAGSRKCLSMLATMALILPNLVSFHLYTVYMHRSNSEHYDTRGTTSVLDGLPLIRSEVASVGYLAVGTCLPVAALLVNLCAPPLEVVHPARINEPKEDDDDAKRQAGI